MLVIGGGVTGTGIARDLCLRGFDVVLIEKKDLNAGASGGNHGLLHSGNSVAFYFQPVVRSFTDPPPQGNYPKQKLFLDLKNN